MRLDTISGWRARWYDAEEPGGRFVAVRGGSPAVGENDWTESDVEAATLDEARELAATLIAEVEEARLEEAQRYDR